MTAPLTPDWDEGYVTPCEATILLACDTIIEAAAFMIENNEMPAPDALATISLNIKNAIVAARAATIRDEHELREMPAGSLVSWMSHDGQREVIARVHHTVEHVVALQLFGNETIIFPSALPYPLMVIRQGSRTR